MLVFLLTRLKIKKGNKKNANTSEEYDILVDMATIF